MTVQFSGFWDQYGQGLMYLAGFLLIGLLCDRLIGWLLTSSAIRRHSKTGEALASSLRGLVTWMFGIVGFWIAFMETPLPAQVNRDISQYLKVATIVVVTAFLARIAGRFIAVYTGREDTRIPASSIFVNLIKGIIWILGIAVTLAALGISITPIVTALGVGGIAVGLALQPTLDNLFSGIQLLASRQIEPGDFVRLETGEEGTVEDVTWRNTTVRRGTGELIIAPNSLLGKSLVINFSRNIHAYSLLIPTTVAYGTDPGLLERIALEVADEVMKASHDVYKGETPTVRFVGIDATGITFNTMLPVLSYNTQWSVRSQFVELLQKKLASEGIEGPSPAMVASKK